MEKVRSYQLDDSSVDWGTLDYYDPAPAGAIKINSFDSIGREVAAPDAQSTQMFMWASKTFPSGVNEYSFEEQLAIIHRKRRLEAAKNASKAQERTLQDILHEKIAAAETAQRETEFRKNEIIREADKIRLEAEKLRLEAELEKIAIQNMKQEIELARITAREALEEAESERQQAEDLMQSAEEDMRVAENILRDITFSMSSISKDLTRQDMDLLDIWLNYAYGIQRRLGQYSHGDERQPSGNATINTVLEIVRDIIASLNERRVFSSLPNIEAFAVGGKKDPTSNEVYQIPDVVALSQAGCSWQSSQPLSQTDNNPDAGQIHDLWNQTVNTTEFREPVKNKSIVYVNDKEDEDDEVDELESRKPNSTKIQSVPIVPVRQSIIIPRKTTTNSRKSFGEQNLENILSSHKRITQVPEVPVSGAAAFTVFQDESILIPSEPLTQKKSEAALKCFQDRSVIDLEECKHQAYSELESDSKIPPNPSEDQTDREPPVPPPRYSVRRSIMQFSYEGEEFNETRKSMGMPADQTIQLVDEVEFQNHITNKRQAASTPKSRTGTVELAKKFDGDETENKINCRPSNYPLSPIMEGSREYKTSSSSGSTQLTTGFKTKKSLILEESVSEEQNIVDPYSDSFLLERKNILKEQLAEDPLSVSYNEPSPRLNPGKSQVKLDKLRFNVEAELGKGNFATVYVARCRSDADRVWALKVQEKDGWWDHYIHSEILRRIQQLPEPEARSSFIVGLERFHYFSDLVTHTYMPLFEQTIVQLINSYQKTTDRFMPELLAMKLTIDVLKAVETIHAVGIIHGDIKADNFLLHSLWDLINASTVDEFLAAHLAVLTDFGCGIDMTLFEPNVRFVSTKKGKKTAGHEILNSRPWTYQIDLFGILDVIHCLLFNEYMKTYCERGVWRITKSFKRSWSDIWESTFHKLLNVPLCDDIPSLSNLRMDFEAAIIEELKSTDIPKFTRQIRVCVFMQRQSCFAAPG